jgi:hypothetical protein
LQPTLLRRNHRITVTEKKVRRIPEVFGRDKVAAGLSARHFLYAESNCIASQSQGERLAVSKIKQERSVIAAKALQ